MTITALIFALVITVVPGLAQGELSGTLTVYPQAYYSPESDAETAAVMEQIAQDYMELHPEVTIELVPALGGSETDYYTWLSARIAAGEAPDLVWDQASFRNTTRRDWYAPITEAFSQPNPYIADGAPGSERWSDSFPDFILGQTRAPDGNYYQVTLDWVETAIFYNADLFEEAGISADWANWGEYIADMNALRESQNVDPLSVYMAGNGWSTWVWPDSIFLSAVWWDAMEAATLPEYAELQPDVPFRLLSSEETAKAFIDGLITGTDERMDTYLRLSQDFASLLPIDFTGLGSYDAALQLFISGQAGSFWGGSWSNSQIFEAADFNVGVTYLPPFTTDDFEGAPNTTYRVGGPYGAAQWGIPVGTVEDGQFDLAVDFLMFLSAPDNFGSLTAASGSFIPLVNGIEAGDAIEAFNVVASLPERMIADRGNSLTPESADEWSTAMQAFLLGEADIETTKAGLQSAMTNGAEALCAQESFSWCP
jgi:multiple sugar transport system substrate-binding protein